MVKEGGRGTVTNDGDGGGGDIADSEGLKEGYVLGERNQETRVESV